MELSLCAFFTTLMYLQNILNRIIKGNKFNQISLVAEEKICTHTYRHTFTHKHMGVLKSRDINALVHSIQINVNTMFANSRHLFSTLLGNGEVGLKTLRDLVFDESSFLT